MSKHDESCPALLLEAAAVGYPGGPPALTDVRLCVHPGERVALIGGNGTGKTALLKTLIGLLVPRAGRVRVHGRDVTGAPLAAVEAGASLVFQNPDDQLFGATVREDALFGPLNQGVEPQLAQERVERALGELGIAALAQRPIEALSFGEKKRACLAGVLCMQPSLLLLDEPSAGLDPLGELAFVELLQQLSGPGRATLVCATHAVDLVPLFAERVVLLAEGRIAADGPASDVFRQTALLERAHVRAPWLAELWLRLHEGDWGDRAPPRTIAEAARRLQLR
ncbi:MAG: ABC transporter ATP-binding protein [Polyangiaceae bacterium]